MQSRQIGRATKRRIVGIKRRAGYRLHCILQYLAIMGRSWFLLPSSWVNASPHNPTWTLDVRQRMTIPIWSHLSILGSSIHFWDHTFKSLICSSSGLWANQAWLFRYHEVKRNVITNSPHLFILLSRFLFAFISEWRDLQSFRHLVHCRDAPGWHHKTNLTLQLSVALAIWKTDHPKSKYDVHKLEVCLFAGLWYIQSELSHEKA